MNPKGWVSALAVTVGAVLVVLIKIEVGWAVIALGFVFAITDVTEALAGGLHEVASAIIEVTKVMIEKKGG